MLFYQVGDLATLITYPWANCYGPVGSFVHFIIGFTNCRGKAVTICLFYTQPLYKVSLEKK